MNGSNATIEAITASSFIGNSADSNGGAIFNNINSTINFIAATAEIGGLTLFSGNTDIDGSNAIINFGTVNFNAGVQDNNMGIIDVQDAITGTGSTISINGTVYKADDTTVIDAPTDGFVMLTTVSGNNLTHHAGALSFADGKTEQEFGSGTFNTALGSVLYVDADLGATTPAVDTINATGDTVAGAVAFRILSNGAVAPLSTIFTGTTTMNGTYATAYTNDYSYNYASGAFAQSDTENANNGLDLALADTGVRTFSLTKDYTGAGGTLDTGTLTLFGNVKDALADTPIADSNIKYGTDLYSINGRESTPITVDNADAKLNVIDMHISNARTAIWNTAGTVTVYNSVFDNNGSGISSYGNTQKIHVFYSTFSNHTSSAIDNRNGVVQLEDVTFNANTYIQEAGSILDSYGAALYNETGTVTSISGNFTNNSVQTTADVSGQSRAYGGAIQSSGTIGSISANFIGNFALADHGNEASGGAIHTFNNLTFAANGQDYTISGNYTSQDGGRTKDYNAIYVGGSGTPLTFSLSNGGSYTLDDNVRAVNAYTVNVSGNGTLNLNNTLFGASAVNVSNATLNLATKDHGGGNIGTGNLDTAALNVTHGTVNVGTNVTMKNSVTLTGSHLNIESGGSFIIGIQLLQADKASSIALLGGTLNSNLSHFGTVDLNAAAGSQFDYTFGIGDFSATDTSTLTLVNIEKNIVRDATLDALKTEIATDIFGDASLNGVINFDGYTALSTATLGDVNSNTNFPTDTIGAGTLTYPGPVIFAAIETGDSTMSGENVQLTLTGRDASSGESNNVLADGDMTVSGGASLTLGDSTNNHINYFGGDITVDGTDSKLVVNSYVIMRGNDGFSRSVELTDGADLHIENNIFRMESLTFSPDSQVNIDKGALILESPHRFSSYLFYHEPRDGRIYIASGATFEAQGMLTLENGSNIFLAENATIRALNGLTLGNAYTLWSGNFGLGNGTLQGGELTVDNASSSLEIIANKTLTIADSSPLHILNGTLSMEDNSTLIAGADIDFGDGGTLQIHSTATLDISGDKLTANVKDFGVVELSDKNYAFTGFNETGANVQANLKGDGTTELVLNSEVQGTILLDNYDAMLAALADSIFGVGHTFNTSNLTITGYGQYNSLTNINTATNTPNVDIAAGTYTHDDTSTFAGIVENRNNIKDSIINTYKGLLNLSGNNAGRILSTGSITVKDGGLSLGYADVATAGGTVQGNLIVDEIAGGYALVTSEGDLVTVTGTTEIKNGGELQVKSGNFTAEGGISVDGAGSSFITKSNVSTESLALTNGGAVDVDAGKTLNVNTAMALEGGSMSVGDGTLQAKGFSMNKTAFTLTGGTLKSTAGIQNSKAVTLNGGNIELASGAWNAGANVAIRNGTLSLASGTSMDMGNRTLSSTNGTLDMSGATLNLSMANLGTVDLDSSSDTFTANNLINGALTSTSTSVLSIAGLSGSLNEFTALSLEKEIKAEAFDSAFLGFIHLEGVDIKTVSLSGVRKAWNTPTETLMAGDLIYNGDTVIAAIAYNTYTNSGDSTVNGQDVNLTLTGLLGEYTRLAEGNMTVSGGATLTLGVDENNHENFFGGDISVDGKDSKLVVNTNVNMQFGSTFHSITLTDGADFDLQRGSLLLMGSLNKSATSQVNIDGRVLLLNSASFKTSDFAAKSTEGKIYLTSDSSLEALKALTLGGGGNLDLQENASIVAASGLILDADTTLTGGEIWLDGGSLSGAKLTVNNSSSKLYINDTVTTANTSPLSILNGALVIDNDTTLIAGADIDFGKNGVLSIASSSTLDISGDKLTANIKDFGTVELDDNKYNFVSFNEDGAEVEANLKGDGTTELVLNTNATGDPILLDNYKDMLTALAESIFGENTTFDTSKLTINGYGQYNTLTNISAATNTPDDVIAAGNYTFGGSSTFAGITADRSGNADSTVNNLNAVLNLTGNGGATLSTGNLTVKLGTLSLGWNGRVGTEGGTVHGDVTIDGFRSFGTSDGKDVVVTGQTNINNGGNFSVTVGSNFTSKGGIHVDGVDANGDASTFTAFEDVTTSSLTLTNGGDLAIALGKTLSVTSAVDLAGGVVEYGPGTFEAAGFTNTTADLTIENTTFRTTDGMVTDKNLTIESGADFDLAGGYMDVSGVVFTAGAGASLVTAIGTTLTADIGTIGVDASATTSGTATVVWDASDNINGLVVIDGLTTRVFDFNKGSELTAYGILSDAAKLAYGDAVKLHFNDISFSGVNLTMVGDNALVGFADTTVSLGNGLTAGTSAIVGAVSGGEGKTLSVGTGSTLTITGNSASDNDGMLYAGDIEIKNGGTADLGRGTVGGALDVATNGTVNIIGETTVAGTTTLAAGSILNVGNINTQGIYSARGETILNGGTVFADPSWIKGQEYQDAATASRAAFLTFGPSGIDGNLIAGQNSQITLGTGFADLLAGHINQMGSEVWGSAGITAALGIYAPQTLNATNGAIDVNGSLTAASNPTANTANFGANSLLVVHADAVGTDAALSATNGKLTVADTAKLHIIDGKDKQVVTVVSGFDATNPITGNGWSNGETDYDNLTNLTLSSSSLTVDNIVWNTTTGAYEVTLKVIFDPAMYAPYMQTPTGEYLNVMTRDAVGIDTDSPFAGRRLLSRALTEDVYGMGLNNAKRSVATIEGAAQLGAVGNVAKGSMSVAQSMGDAIITRSSKIGLRNMNDGKGSGSMTMNNGQVTAEVGANGGNMANKSGFGVWLTPLYKWNIGNGFDAGNLGHSYDMGLGGIALGADYTNAFAHDGAIRFGLALNVGAGYSDSTGDFNETNNDFNFWGLSAYAALQKENFVATLDLGFSSIYNEVTQSLPASMQMGSLNTNIDSFVFTAGLNLEYTFVTDFMNITPHAGVRYMSVTSYGYDIESSAGRVASVDETTQDVWYFPVGVTFSKDIVSESGWVFTPKLDVGFIAAAGDFDAVSKSRFTGVPGTLELEMQNVNGFAFNGGLGFELSNKETGVSLGLNYNLQAGEKETSHMIFANFRYEF